MTKGLYILSNDILKDTNTIKIGMSEKLEKKLHDYVTVFKPK